MTPLMRALTMLLAALAWLALTFAPPAGAAVRSDSTPDADRAAWQHFAAVAAPAGKGRVVFETWAADDDIYTSKPNWPGEAALDQRRLRQGSLQRPAMPHAMRTGGATTDCEEIAGDSAPMALPGRQPCFSGEVRRNMAAYRYIVQNQLNTKAGLAGAFKKAQGGWRVSLPEDSVAVKADWVPVDTIIAWLGRNAQRLSPAQVRAQYYTTVAQGQSFALVALHISSKQQPGWVWASFEHRMNPGRCDALGCSDQFGAVRTRIPAAKVADRPYPACGQSDALGEVFKAKRLHAVWSNYCLKAAESIQAPAVAVNAASHGERLPNAAVRKTTCVACHATAGFGRDGRAYTKLLTSHQVGAVRLPDDIVANDFSWGILAIGVTAAQLDLIKLSARR